MKKQTISALLTALMICLTIAIVVVIVQIQMRGLPPEADADSDSYIVQEDFDSQNSVSDDQAVEKPSEAVTVLVAIPNANSSVNVRSGPGTEYNRLGSAYSNNEYEVLEILSNGWTKLLYSSGQEAYINSEYVDYKLRTTDNGNILYDTPSEADLAEYKNGVNPSSAGEDPQGNETPENDTAE